MTKSTITDKRVTSVIERLEHYACNLKWTNVRGAQDLLAAADGLRELQERRKADSEPVAEVVSIYGDPEAFGEREIRPLVGIQQMPYGTKLYHHAQQPVVPDELLKEYLRLVDCMLSDYRNSNYGDAQRWIGHIVEASDAFEEKHGLSPWEMARKNCREAMIAATQKDSKS